MRQQPGLRRRKVYVVAGRPVKQIAARKKAHSGETEIVGRPARHRPAAASDPHDPLYRLVQADDVDRCGNTIRCAGNAVIIYLWLFGAAHYQYWNLGPPSDSQNRIGAGRRRLAEVEDDHIGAAAADQVKKMGLERTRPIASRYPDLCTPRYRQIFSCKQYSRSRAHQLILILCCNLL
jgi:hypothetical protein